MHPNLLQQQWLTTYENWRSFTKQCSNNTQHLVQYEHLVADKKGSVQKLCAELGLKAHFSDTIEKAKVSKASSQSKYFGFKFSNEVIELANYLGYNEQQVQGVPSLKWHIYEYYISFVYSPAKALFRKLKANGL